MTYQEVLIAEVIHSWTEVFTGEELDIHKVAELTNDMADALAIANPLFDRERFIDVATGVGSQ